MKNFLDLLATELQLEIVTDGKITHAGLHDPLIFNTTKCNTVIVDGIEILPKYLDLVNNKVLIIREPFYQWYHRVSGQGWLLTPH
jgi:hypothetical protein